jgi:acyl carrier protein
MDEKQMRLANCFLMVFPDLTSDAVTLASSSSVQGWDSVATVTLLAIVEEEFGIRIDVEDLAKFDSFKGILSFLQESQQQCNGLHYDGDFAL